MLSGMAGQGSTPNKRRYFGGSDGPNWARIVVAVLAFIYAVVFVLLNRAKVKVHFVFFSVSTHLWVGFLVCLVVGALLGQALGAYRRRSVKPGRSGRDEAA
jgi:uncharacterized integral membrane protein